MEKSDDDNMATIGCLVAVNCLKKTRVKKRERSVWVKEWLSKRAQYSHVNLINELRICPKDWQNYLRMDEDTYISHPFYQKKLYGYETSHFTP